MRKSRFGKDNGAFKGESVTTTGYVYVYSPDHPNRTKSNYVLKHRLVMEKSIGRYLDKKEVVHHKNGNRSDNRIKNLELFDTNGQHIKEEARLGVLRKTEETKMKISKIAKINYLNRERNIQGQFI